MGSSSPEKNTERSFSSLDDISDTFLKETVENMRRDNHLLQMENLILESFLERHEPKLLAGIQTILDQASRIQGQLGQVHGTMITQDESSRSSRSSTSRLSMLSSFSDTTQRINLVTKIELLRSGRTCYYAAVEEFFIKMNKERENVRAQLEEIGTRILETQDAQNIFEQIVVIGGVNPVTQKIPADKFIRYMEEWLKCAECTIEKFRLRNATLKYKKKQLLNILKQKEELNETIRPVDLDQMKIDHRELMKKVELRNIDLIDLKRRGGNCNLLLSQAKIKMVESMRLLNKIKQEKEKRKIKLKNVENETIETQKGVDISIKNIQKLKDLNAAYKVPDLMEYILQKKEIFRLKQECKIWKRKNSLQNVSLQTCTKIMKRITGRAVEDPTWFKTTTTPADDRSFKYYDKEDY